MASTRHPNSDCVGISFPICITARTCFGCYAPVISNNKRLRKVLCHHRPSNLIVLVGPTVIASLISLANEIICFIIHSSYGWLLSVKKRRLFLYKTTAIQVDLWYTFVYLVLQRQRNAFFERKLPKTK